MVLGCPPLSAELTKHCTVTSRIHQTEGVRELLRQSNNRSAPRESLVRLSEQPHDERRVGPTSGPGKSPSLIFFVSLRIVAHRAAGKMSAGGCKFPLVIEGHSQS